MEILVVQFNVTETVSEFRLEEYFPSILVLYGDHHRSPVQISVSGYSGPLFADQPAIKWHVNGHAKNGTLVLRTSSKRCPICKGVRSNGIDPDRIGWSDPVDPSMSQAIMNQAVVDQKSIRAVLGQETLLNHGVFPVIQPVPGGSGFETFRKTETSRNYSVTVMAYT